MTTSNLSNQGLSYDPLDHGLGGAEIECRNALGDALETVLGNGANDLVSMSAGLNALKFCTPNGQPWTESLLAAELDRLSR